MTTTAPSEDDDIRPDDTLEYKLAKDIRAAAATLTHTQARFAVDRYYQLQKDRIGTHSQIRAIEEKSEEGGLGDEPHALLDAIATRNADLEGSIKLALGIYAKASPLGRWALSVKGVGPVISAGLVANIDISVCPTVGHIWAFAGLDPTKRWAPKTKRPWNARLKVLTTYKLGESFVKVQGREGAIYGQVFAARKRLEWERNLAGEFAAQAEVKAKAVGDGTTAIKWYSGAVDPGWARATLESGAGWPEKMPAAAASSSNFPMLPPAHIHSRARRYAVKLFLSHYHYVGYRILHGTPPPLPYILTQEGGHAHFIAPPNIDDIENL